MCLWKSPCAVDPVGARSILKSGKIAQSKGLSIISGTIRRSQRDCIETYRRVAEGAIGDIVSAQVLRNGSSLWHKDRQPEWSDMEYMMRNWPNFCWVSGDMPLEQFIHEIDMMSWFLGDKKPVSATAVGGRARRVTGDVYDFYSIQYQYDNGMRTNCTSRPDRWLRQRTERDGVWHQRFDQLFRYDLPSGRDDCLAVPAPQTPKTRIRRGPSKIPMCRS